jgi:NAD(P)-dependent dehydrogenase (short-subunit alcohol dehydrogenase family)
MLIAQGRLQPGSLSGRVAVVTGAGGGIGFETARALLWLGARVVVAELDERSGADAGERLAREWPPESSTFVATDVSDEASVGRLKAITEDRFGHVDVVVNNATVAAVGRRVHETDVEDWDRSYGVNLRGPVLLARAFLPGMIARGSGVFVCVSSTGGPFLAAYETLKAAQVALAGSLDAELEGTGVTAFTIGPGLVPTPTAVAAVGLLAPRLGLSLPEFYAMNRGALLSVEAAGAGFAAAIAMAERYAGQEISSTQALIDAGIEVTDEGTLPSGVELPPRAQQAGSDQSAREPAGPLTELQPSVEREGRSARDLAHAVHSTLAEQSADWRERSFFERQWMFRDFKQRAGMPVERWLESLERLAHRLDKGEMVSATDRPPLEKLAAFYGHMAELARGYVKDPRERDEQVRIVLAWQEEVDLLRSRLP